MRSVIVICGGWSVSQYDVADLRERGYVIGVNESSVLFHCNEGITMDRLWAEHRFHQYIETRVGDLWVRQAAAKNLQRSPRLRTFKCDHESCSMSYADGILNGTNSGMVALNRALRLAETRCYVFGLDMQKGPNGEPYHHPPYEWADPKGATKPGKYKSWEPGFLHVMAHYMKSGVRLVQVNNRSAVRAIPSISYEQFLEETK